MAAKKRVTKTKEKPAPKVVEIVPQIVYVPVKMSTREWLLGLSIAALVGCIFGTMTLAVLITYVYPIHF